MDIRQIIVEQTEILFWNIQNSMDSVPDKCWNKVLYDAPVWWYLYHNLRSLDKWFMWDNNSCEELSGEKELSRKQLTEYFNEIKNKVFLYLRGLTYDMLTEKPEDCQYTRFALILGQFRHAMCHVGIISGAMIYETGKCPEYKGLDYQKNQDN